MIYSLEFIDNNLEVSEVTGVRKFLCMLRNWNSPITGWFIYFIFSSLGFRLVKNKTTTANILIKRNRWAKILYICGNSSEVSKKKRVLELYNIIESIECFARSKGCIGIISTTTILNVRSSRKKGYVRRNRLFDNIINNFHLNRFQKEF